MARKKDLGSLAALAGLAYMASRDKATKGDVPVEDRTGSATGFMNEKEPGWDTKGSEYGTEKEPGWDSGTAPARKPAAKRAAAPAGGGGLENARDALLMRRGQVPSTTEEGMRGYTPRRQSQAASTTEEGMRGYVPRRTPGALADIDRPGTRTRYENEDSGMKKGGSVKGWGIARGARKAKTY